MPHDYIRSERRYRDANGKPVSRNELRGLIDKLTTHVEKEAAKLAKSYTAKRISLAEFHTGMRELLKSAHIVASTVGRGGRAMMTQADWGRVGAKVKWQFSYLEKFTRKLGAGRLSEALSASRARAYASSIYISFANSFQESQVEKLEPSGDQTKDENILVRLITNSEEGCPECAADEALGWMKPEDMGELGSRICGDFCKCTLEFSDE